MTVSYKEASHKNWSNGTDEFNLDEINSGTFQRIADATERMAASSEVMSKNFVQLQNDEAYYRSKYHQKCEEINNLRRQINGYKGKLQQLKNKTNNHEQTPNREQSKTRTNKRND